MLAKAQHLPDTPIPSAIAQLETWIAAGDTDWLWLIVETALRPSLWPTCRGSFVTDAGGAPVPDQQYLQQCLLPQSARSAPRSDRQAARIRFWPTIVTVNVQTLAEDRDAGVDGRVQYIREQLEGQQICITGLQETRAKQSATIVSATHLRYLSQQEANGTLGVELWLSRTVPFAWQGRTPLVFEQADIRVLFTSPRALIAKFSRGFLQFFLVVIHAPSADDSERERWWKQLHDRLITTAKGQNVLLIGDFNVRLHHTLPGRIGDLVWESGSQPPPYFFKLIDGLDVWFPSTFHGIHFGDSYTWVSPGQGTSSRIDYIAVPSQWAVKADSSRVLYEVDFGQKGLDHFGVTLQVDVWFEHAACRRQSAQRLDRSAMQSPDAGPKLDSICQSVPTPPWTVDAHTHYTDIAIHYRNALTQAFPAKGATPRQPFFSPATWGMRQQRIDLRRNISKAMQVCATTEIAAAFLALRRGTLVYATLLPRFAALLRATYQVTKAVAELRLLQPALRREIRRDRKGYLAKVAREAANSSTKDIVQKLRPLLGPPKRKSRGTQALPLVTLEDGTVAQTAEQADRRWVRHFASIEDGGPIGIEEHIASCLQRQSAVDLDCIDLCRNDIPTLFDIERNLRASQSGKAIGNDGVPADLLHLRAAGTAKAVYQVFLKAAFRMQEPLAWKGGALHGIWKGRGSQADCSNYRAILVSSAIGKSHTRDFPRKMLPDA